MHEKPNHDPSTQRYPKKGDVVCVSEKVNYKNGILTEGTVQDVLTSKKTHPRGHKVRLTDGTIGRVQEFVGDEKPVTPQNTTLQAQEKEEEISTNVEPIEGDLDLR
ncbi:hypothetical protein COX05_02780 [candidate division WWE3 bacterium CG22_combo_CG10-13_8_21_14_all_39_12]|uniref:YwbE family protein n=2 Tax=Katanobacteria TaxID=422282 RepID=A0A2M7X1V4_UNCKA|nr:MAG: hypothetical protein COX05_02780 [candidate division WWE3 bacterium CG22_combo_CG10-13_8_21_14_all_39_12]PJA40156.1 MAG: hypothetical protein CO179_03155 [candidate division WWE3 bacterium CG_4_9_14_3_um_filter_39_7]